MADAVIAIRNDVCVYASIQRNSSVHVHILRSLFVSFFFRFLVCFLDIASCRQAGPHAVWSTKWIADREMGGLLDGGDRMPGSAAYGQTISTANVGANQATLQLTSSATWTGYFTLLVGAGTTCGMAAQTVAGQGSTGAAAFRFGSLPLTASAAGSYTVKNLTASSTYTVCLTPDGSARRRRRRT